MEYLSPNFDSFSINPKLFGLLSLKGEYRLKLLSTKLLFVKDSLFIIGDIFFELSSPEKICDEILLLEFLKADLELESEKETLERCQHIINGIFLDVLNIGELISFCFISIDKLLLTIFFNKFPSMLNIKYLSNDIKINLFEFPVYINKASLFIYLFGEYIIL